jgi:hypothetical protein
MPSSPSLDQRAPHCDPNGADHAFLSSDKDDAGVYWIEDQVEKLDRMTDAGKAGLVEWES